MIDEIMQRALDDFVETLHADAGDVKVRDADGWVVSYQNGFGPQDVGLHLAEPDAPVAVRVYTGREPVVVADYSKEPEFYTGFPRAHKLTATLAVPLIVRDEVVGALFAQMTTGPREFSDAELDIAVRLAAWVALALDNARLLDSERIRIARIEALSEVSNLIVSALEPREVARRALDYVVNRLGISAAAAWQTVDEATMELIASANFPPAYIDQTKSLPSGSLSPASPSSPRTWLSGIRERSSASARWVFASARTRSCRSSRRVGLSACWGSRGPSLGRFPRRTSTSTLHSQASSVSRLRMHGCLRQRRSNLRERTCFKTSRCPRLPRASPVRSRKRRSPRFTGTLG